MGGRRGRRGGTRALGVEPVAVRVEGGAGRARALLPRARRGRRGAAAPGAVESRRLREQRRPACCGHRFGVAPTPHTSVAYRVVVRALTLLGVLVAVATLAAGARGGTPKTAELRLDGVVFRPELALTPAQQQRGLMYRTRAPRDGMLFVFAHASTGGFWMKNTLVPLRIVFFDTAGKRVRGLTMTPCKKDPCRVYDPGRQYRFALELPASDRRPSLRLGPPADLRRLLASAS